MVSRRGKKVDGVYDVWRHSGGVNGATVFPAKADGAPTLRRQYGTVKAGGVVIGRFAQYCMIADDGNKGRPALFQVFPAKSQPRKAKSPSAGGKREPPDELAESLLGESTRPPQPQRKRAATAATVAMAAVSLVGTALLLLLHWQSGRGSGGSNTDPGGRGWCGTCCSNVILADLHVLPRCHSQQ